MSVPTPGNAIPGGAFGGLYVEHELIVVERKAIIQRWLHGMMVGGGGRGSRT